MGHYAGLSGIDLAWKWIAHCSTQPAGMLLSTIRAYSEQVTDYFKDNYSVCCGLLYSVGSYKSWLQRHDVRSLRCISRLKFISQNLNDVEYQTRLFKCYAMLLEREAVILLGCTVLRWGLWCAAALSLLTAHLSHFVSDCSHLHGPISSSVARSWRDHVLVFVLKPHKRTNISFLLNMRAERGFTDEKQACLIAYFFYPFILGNCFPCIVTLVYIMPKSTHKTTLHCFDHKRCVLFMKNVLKHLL